MNISRSARVAVSVSSRLATGCAHLLKLALHPTGIERNGALVLCIPGAPIVRLK